jgi:hypothetical protein
MKILLTLACIQAVASGYSVPEDDLKLLFVQEHGRVGEKVSNKNGTFDYGPFQINDVWVPAFTRLWRLSSAEETKDKLMNDGCWNAAAGAAVYRQALDDTHGDREAALGRYHSRTPSLASAYLAQLKGKYRSLFGKPMESVAR